MALTDINTVKRVMQFQDVDINAVQNEMIRLDNTTATQLQNASIAEDTDVLKLLEINTPLADSGNPITLNAGASVNLDQQKIVWDSVLVADSLALTTVYVENLDYVIDYFNGAISLADPIGSIADGGAVYVWYLYYTVKSRTTDYSINRDEGQITRRTGTTIPDGAKVYVDYNFSSISPTDSAINECIEQAEEFIIARLKSQYDYDSDDVGLKSGATNFVLHLLCLSQSFNELSGNTKDNSDDVGRRWQDLADKYLTVAMTHLSKYLRFTPAEYAGLIQNRFPKSRRRHKYSPTLSSQERPY